MKQLIDLRTNYLAVWTEEKKLVPMVEVVLVMSEASYVFDAEGKAQHRVEASQSRFVIPAGSLRSLAASLLGIADEAEKQLAEIKPA